MELTVPVLRFRSEEECGRAVAVLRDQQFEVTLESATEVGCRPWSDLDEAQALLEAEGIICERANNAVTRMRPRAPQPRP